MSCRRTMISSRTVCFVYFALLFGTPNASKTSVTEESGTNNSMSMTNEINVTPTTSTNKKLSPDPNTDETTSLNTASTQTTTKPEEGYCIFSLPTDGNKLQLIVAALTVGCLVLLLTTLICSCQVCHLRGIISSLQPRYDSTDEHARREKSESPRRDEGQVDGHPTETCLMLSEVTTAQEESREDQKNETEEKNDTEQSSAEPPVKDPNGDITQENSPEPDAKAPESSDTEV